MRINFFIPEQFGYSAGYLYYSKYLLSYGYSVTIYCIDNKLPRINPIQGVQTIYLVLNRNKTLMRIFEMLSLFRSIMTNKCSEDISIIKYFPLCSLLFPCKKNNIFLDIRTGAITNKLYKRILLNSILCIDSFFFKKGFVLSELMRKNLRLSSKKYTLLPLGADVFSTNAKDYIRELNLLYVGTLNYREIYKTVLGLSLVKKQISIPINYDIIGYGTKEEEELLNKIIKQEKAESYINFIGRKTHDQLRPFFDKANIGISFVPKTCFYDIQPPTKIYEYALSGLFTLATSTSANKEIITSKNGLLHDDTKESFAQAILFYVNNLSGNISEKEIRNSLKSHLWSNIVLEKMLKRIEG